MNLIKCPLCNGNIIQSYNSNIQKAECENGCILETLEDNGRDLNGELLINIKGAEFSYKGSLYDEDANRRMNMVYDHAKLKIQSLLDKI